MKAFLLAAGKGTRLKPLTDSIPKCLVPVNGRPLVEHWFDLFERYGIKDILINTHYLHKDVERYLLKNKRDNIKITVFHEDELLGTGGTVKANKEFIQDITDFFIFYADNFTTIDLDKMIKSHLAHAKTMTVGVFKTDTPQACGIVEVDENNMVINFEEKPAKPKNDLAASGIYIARKKLFEYFPVSASFDFGRDVFPRMAGDMVVYRIQEYFLDIGTLENYRKVNQEFS